MTDIAGLIERLMREVPSGRYTIGSGAISYDGNFSGTPSLPIMTLANPDGPEAATALAELSAKLVDVEAQRDHAHRSVQSFLDGGMSKRALELMSITVAESVREALATATARIAELEGALDEIEGIASGSTTANSLPHIAKMALQALGRAS